MECHRIAASHLRGNLNTGVISPILTTDIPFCSSVEITLSFKLIALGFVNLHSAVKLVLKWHLQHTFYLCRWFFQFSILESKILTIINHSLTRKAVSPHDVMWLSHSYVMNNEECLNLNFVRNDISSNLQ